MPRCDSQDSSASERALMAASMTWLAKDTCESTYKSYDFSWTDRMACADNANGATLCKVYTLLGYMSNCKR